LFVKKGVQADHLYDTSRLTTEFPLIRYINFGLKGVGSESSLVIQTGDKPCICAINDGAMGRKTNEAGTTEEGGGILPMPKKSVKRSKNSAGLNALKRNLAGKEETVTEILSDVNRVTPDQWKNPAQVERLAREYINKLGLSVPEQRIKKFVDAYQDATKNRSSNVDEWIKKYGKNVDEHTAKTIKKYVPK
jgi:hypothetical protein